MTLKDLPIGKTATVRTVGGEGALRHHFLDMGLIPTASVTMVKYAPMGDPVEVRIHSYELTLRLADAEKIEIENVARQEPKQRTKRNMGFRWRARSITLDSEKVENTIQRRRNTHCRMAPFCVCPGR